MDKIAEEEEFSNTYDLPLYPTISSTLFSLI